MSDQQQPVRFAYDLFVSYSPADREWVEGYLLDALSTAGVRVYSEAAFALGAPRLSEFEAALRQSKRTLLVLSPAYMAEAALQFVDLMVQSFGLESGTWPVIPLIREPVKLPPRLAFLVALDASDPQGWPDVITRLCSTLQAAAPAPTARPICPYPGMRAFRQQESSHFYGRQREVEELLQRLRHHPFMAVIGPSGSGKSSLIFAGLLPALQRSTLFEAGEWLVRSIRPGALPLAELAASLGTGDIQAFTPIALLNTVANANRLLLVIDQFEEVFTQGGAQQADFFAALQRLLSLRDCFVVIAVRADFYSDLLTSSLWPLIQAHRLEIAPLDEQGLRAAIVKPAEDVGVFIESALVERLAANSAGQPGVLPFVQEVLVRLWEKLERRFLPLRAYEALVLPYARILGSELSGIQAAMAQLADEIVAQLTPDQQRIARRIFLRLVQFGEGRADTRRQQPVSALAADGDDAALFNRTLHHLADNRLVTLSGEEQGEPRADLAHEAMLTGWPRLKQWIAERSAGEQARRRLEQKAAEWVRLGSAEGGLLDHVELDDAVAWLNSESAAELGHSPQLVQLVEQSNLALAQRAAETRRTKLVRGVALGGVALLLVALAAWLIWPRVVRSRTGSELIPIAAGTAILGTAAPDRLPEEQPLRTATLQGYVLERNEVSNDQYRACVESGPCVAPKTLDLFDDPALADHPVVHVTAEQAQVFCHWLGRRLPTSAEWERAVRGATGRQWPWGDDPDWYGKIGFQPGTVPSMQITGSETPSPEVLLHLVDNVSELVVMAPPDCQGAACHADWDGVNDVVINLVGGAYDRGIDRVSYAEHLTGQVEDASLGFRCASSETR